MRPSLKSEITNSYGINVYVLSTTDGPARGGVNYLGNGDLGSGMAFFRTLADMLTVGNGGRFRHELIHASGFGHGCGWRGIQNSFCDGIDRGNNEATPGLPSSYDVAYIQLMYLTRDIEREYNSSQYSVFSIMESHQGERTLMLGLPAERVSRAP